MLRRVVSGEVAALAPVGRQGVGRDVRLVPLVQLQVAAIGVAFGVVISVTLTPQLGGFLYEVSPRDSSTFLSVALVLVPAVLCASYFPARRAARIDPLIALKSS